MGDFQGMAEKIASILGEMKLEGEVRPEDIKRIIPEAVGRHAGGSGNINFYPYGEPGRCCDFALFLSLQTSAYIKPGRRGHLSCEHAMKKIVQHMQGDCSKITRAAVLITDDWCGKTFQVWKGNIDQIKKYAHIEVYLLAGGKVTEINI